MDEFKEFMGDFHNLTGIDLTLYKRPQMERRLTALRNKHGYHTFQELYAALQKDERLLFEFLDRMTINVSEFFRNPERWDLLVPFLKEIQGSQSLKVWSAACSTGEEPYTLAILMKEQVKRQCEILATDIDRNVLTLAQKGFYREHQIKAVPKTYLDRYFTVKNGVYYVDDGLKDSITYKLHNLLADKYPDGLDMIVCRNVLIYFTDEAKYKVISSFAKALKPGGLLFVGSTEQFMKAEEVGLASVAPFLYRRK